MNLHGNEKICECNYNEIKLKTLRAYIQILKYQKKNHWIMLLDIVQSSGLLYADRSDMKS